MGAELCISPSLVLRQSLHLLHASVREDLYLVQYTLLDSRNCRTEIVKSVSVVKQGDLLHSP